MSESVFGCKRDCGSTAGNRLWSIVGCLTFAMLSVVAAGKEASQETVARAQIAATNLADAVVVDCQLPGKLIQLGGSRTYMTPGALMRLAAIDCRTRGGEYTVGDLASGTLSLRRWLPLAEKGDNVEAQYYVARIYANGMDNVPVDYSKAADWYKRAAKSNFQPAMQELGYLYEQGLGVPKDALAGLNLQRQASGLGEQLDYASKIAANEEESTKRVTALTSQLDAANGDVQDLRKQLEAANDRVLQSSAQIGRDRTHIADLHRELEAARQDGSGQSAARIASLQQQLGDAEKQLGEKQSDIGALNAQMAEQQLEMSQELARSQAANAKLNELVSSTRDDGTALRARLAQYEQRLNESQQELSTLRAKYLQETSALAERSDQIQRLRSQGADNIQGLLAVKDSELQQQRTQIDALQKQLAGAASAGSRAEELQRALDTLKAQYTVQQQQLQAQRTEMSRVQTLSKDEKAELVAQMTTQLAQRAAELAASQKRIATLQAESDQWRDTLARERAGHAQAVAVASNASDQQRAALEKLQMQLAASQLELVQVRERFGQQAGGKRISELEADVRAKDQQIATLHFDLAKVGEPVARPMAAVNTAPQAVAAAIAEPDSLIKLVRSLGTAHYHALVIGNSTYAHMPALPTPVNDAKDVANTLTSRYGFDVKLLTNVTADQIMKAMNEYARTLDDSDRLLIYYAGHGDTKIFPPERAFWLGIDADPELPSTWLSAQTVADAMSMIHARHILLVADSCFSNAITHVASTTVVRLDDERSTAIRWNKAARMILTSGVNEPATDVRVPDKNHSMFAYLFIAALRQNTILMSGEMLAHDLNNRLSVYPDKGGAKPATTYANLQDPQHKFGDFFFVPLPRDTQLAALTP